MKIELDIKHKQIDPKEIEVFESKTGYKLPEDYKKFLLEHNGGIIKAYHKEGFYFGYKLSYYNGEEAFFNINWFYGLNKHNETYFFIEEDPYEKEVYGDYGIQLAIATGQPKLICLCLEGEDYGCVFALEDEYWVVDPEINFVKVANSFDEFINGFDYYPIEDN